MAMFMNKSPKLCAIWESIKDGLNLFSDAGAIPVLNQVMIATRGATDAFSGVQKHVNSSLRKVGAKNIEAGIGCGVGFGHGFGVGLAVKPAVLHQIQSHFWQVAGSVMLKLGIGSNSSFPLNEGVFQGSLETGMSKVKEPSHENQAGIDTEYRSRTETVINNFLKNPLLEKGSSLHDQAGPLQLENDLLQMVLKHQVLIEELMKENEKLRQILVEELKVQPSKLQFSFTSRSNSSCTECFECRRKQRKRSPSGLSIISHGIRGEACIA
ncbi:hypothetical protein Sango_2292900 [Sesamum angolense]|uniref:Uncharacterized protein n=1 Tax=Sesamum angolense TaxID=2727404 RepID=A0AAE1WA21_9LAMI|nr:hypothetical protein Sango_2292900 [Sesamum angolense]